MSKNDAVCRCGHSQAAHEHYRRGSDCAICGAEGCHHFRRDRNATAVASIESVPPANTVLPVATLAEPVDASDILPPRRRAG